MQCFEGALMREYLFGLVRELDATARRDDLLLDDLLDSHGIESMSGLLELGSGKMMALVRELSSQLPLAA
jgi:hypothetical protein